MAWPLKRRGFRSRRRASSRQAGDSSADARRRTGPVPSCRPTRSELSADVFRAVQDWSRVPTGARAATRRCDQGARRAAAPRSGFAPDRRAPVGFRAGPPIPAKPAEGSGESESGADLAVADSPLSARRRPAGGRRATRPVAGRLRPSRCVFCNPTGRRPE